MSATNILTQNIFTDIYSSKSGDIHITADNEGLLKVEFAIKQAEKLLVNSNSVTNQAKLALEKYFVSGKPLPTIKISAKSTPFQKKVYDFLCKNVTFGYTSSYKDLALALQSGPRAIGNAMARNSVALFIPCHRVLNNNGKLGGFLYGLDLKKQLLDHEKSLF